MTTEVSKTKYQVPATMSNLYTEYGLTVASGNIEFLKFKKGIYSYGSAGNVLPVDTRVVANMPELTVGPLKWLDGKPVAVAAKTGGSVVAIAAGQATLFVDDVFVVSL